MTATAWLNDAIQRLSESGASEAELDAKWMLADALGLPSLGGLRFRLSDSLTDDQARALNKWLAKRAAGLPLQYAQNCAYFMGRAFYVDERVLIPRQDTEILCEKALARLPRGGSALDLCTGSGILAVSIALARPDATVCASDLSGDALAVARENADRHDVRIEFLQGDFLDAAAGRRFDIIVCNPPYLTGADMRELQPEVTREPKEALYGGDDGLDFYRRARFVRAFLSPGGFALFEVGAGQAGAVSQMLRAQNVYRDLAGIERVVETRNDMQ